VEPDAELPGDLEIGERGAMVAGDRVARGVAGAPDFAEELSYLAREDALVLQASKQVVLRSSRDDV
jgi:hypothetical protein